jgi:myo-inositol-1(or 4)-monophosphatase
VQQRPSVPADPLPVLLDLAVRAARLGGRQLLERAGRGAGVSHKSSATDPVSDADRASEAIVVATITRQRPNDGLIGEEGARRSGSSGLRWVIDPLDGTVNYLRERTQVAVSIACEQEWDGGWHPLLGVVHDPFRGEMFTAVRGRGAQLDGMPVRVRAGADPAGALVATGFSYRAESRARQGAQISALLPRVGDIRSLGSAALELCWVAAGRSDGYYEDELEPWDWAAGALIAQEAGAGVRALGTGVIAAVPAVHDLIVSTLTPSLSAVENSEKARPLL